uniref:Uncharacterized protein n=1 Tax=Avena sativa TaxID=4498 RepID=A0ACD5ZYA9_AVESA
MRNSCESCRRYRNHLHGKATRFVRRMDKNSTQSLVIPERFVNHFVGKMLGTIRLEGPNRIVYDVGVTKHKNRPILQSGWDVFVDANNIVEKDSLMFRYRGRSRFKVAVFDSGGCEKRVTCAGIGSTTSDQEPVTNSTDMSRNSESSGHCTKRTRTDATSSQSEDLSGEDSPSEHESSDSDDHTLSEPLYVLSGQCDVTEEQEANIVALVQEIQPEMPLLVAVMKKPNVIPKDYTIAYFPHKSQTITLQLARQSKTWHCKLLVRPDGGRCNLYGCHFVRDNHLLEGDLCLFQPMANGNGTTFTMMIHVLRKESTGHPSDGSPVFGSNNGLPSTEVTSIIRVKEEQSDASGRSDGCQSGRSSYSRNSTKIAAISSSSEESGEECPSDSDLFESDDVRTPREHDYVLSNRCYLSDTQKEKVVMLLRDIQPRTRVFVAIMRKYNVQPPYPSLIISKEYGVVHFPHESASVTLRSPGVNKKWHPRFYKANDASMHRIRGQWFDFVYDNRVEEGDICIFVPAKGGRRFRFRVHLLRAERDMHAGPFVPPYILPQNSCLSPLQQIIVEDKMQTIQSEAPLYVAIMKNSSVGVNGHCVLEFGAQYADTYLPKREEPILLQHKGKIWHTKLRIWSHRTRRRRVLDGGWRKFVRDNHLQVGDTCLFELKNNNQNKLTMMVHIIPSDQC